MFDRRTNEDIYKKVELGNEINVDTIKQEMEMTDWQETGQMKRKK